jgi:predicted Zn-dependent peptidase
MVQEKRYSNGLRVVVKQMPGLYSVSIGILVGTGGAMETDAEDGISHFIEHMQFKGTSKRNAFEVSDAFDRIGAQVNAFTGKDSTCYYTKCTADHVDGAFEALSDLFLNATYPEDEMEREKGVVCEEISMNEDAPEDLCLDLLAKATYGNQYYGRNILGPASNVKGFTVEDIRRYKEARYCPENIVISFAGGIDFTTAIALVETYFGNLSQGKFEKRILTPQFLGQSLYKKKPIEQLHFALSYPSIPMNHALDLPATIMNSILGGSMSSRLFQEVREKMGLAYSVYSYASRYKECGNLTVYAGVNPTKATDAYEAVNAVIAELAKNGITDDEFMRGREQIKASTIFGLESTSSQMLIYGKEMLFNDRLYNIDERFEKLQAIEKSAVEEAIAQTFGDKNAIKAVAVVANTDKTLPL